MKASGIIRHSDAQRVIFYNEFISIVPDSLKGDKNMDYITMRARIEDIVNDNHRDFVKAMISIEKGINDESTLDKLYDTYMDNDSLNLLHEEFDYMIEDLREQGQIKDLPYVKEEKDNLINVVGSIVGEIYIIERENKNFHFPLKKDNSTPFVAYATKLFSSLTIISIY